MPYTLTGRTGSMGKQHFFYHLNIFPFSHLYWRTFPKAAYILAINQYSNTSNTIEVILYFSRSVLKRC